MDISTILLCIIGGFSVALFSSVLSRSCKASGAQFQPLAETMDGDADDADGELESGTANRVIFPLELELEKKE